MNFERVLQKVLWRLVMRKWLGLGILIGAELGSVAWAQGLAGFDGQYVGELSLTKVISGDCTEPPLGARYPLTISGGQMRFKYVPRFDTTLIGRVDEKGNFKASRRLKRGLISMTGHIDGSNLTASIQSPSCQYAFRTKHSHVRRFQMQANESVACMQALVSGSSGQGRRRGR